MGRVTKLPLPARSAEHQRVLARLALLLHEHAPAELEPLQGVGVRAGRSLLVPDLMVAPADVVLADVAAFDADQVELVVEVVSPSTVTMDRVMKPVLYAAAGIPTYWRIECDHAAGVMIAVHELAGDSYRLVSELVGTIEHQLDTPFPLPIRPADLLLPR